MTAHTHDRCEPPEHLRAMYAPHYVQPPNSEKAPVAVWWSPHFGPLGAWMEPVMAHPKAAYAAGWRYCGPVPAFAKVEALRAENEQLRLAIQGGEDAPGHALSIPLDAILSNAQNLHADAIGGRDVTTLRARVETLEAALRCVVELDRHHSPSTTDGRDWTFLTRTFADIARAALEGKQ